MTNTTNYVLTNPCLDKYWLFSLYSSLATVGGGFLLICACKGFQFLINKELLQSKVSLILKRRCQYFVSGRTLIGKILISSSCLFSISSLIIYLIEASKNYKDVPEFDSDWLAEQHMYYLDLSFNIFLSVMFIIKFVAADNKILFWLSLHSLVDLMTIPPLVASVALRRQWLGLRFMRAFRVMSIPDILQYLRLIKTPQNIRFAQLLSILTSILLAAAGFIQLLEICGDFKMDFQIPGIETYWESFYLVMITMSTVGFGDVTCKTVSGRIFICFFILTTLAFVASYIPEIAELIGSRKRRLKVSLQVESDMNHIVVCGNLSYRALNNFLMDFLHPDRKETKMTKVVVMNKKPLSLDIEALLKGYFTRVVRMRESPFRVEGLKRVKMNEADACVIMANQKSKKPEVDDMRNIMRAISIKNFSSTKIIIQLLKPESQKYLENLPRWQKFVDKIVCLSQVKQSIMAAGCLTPGFSTLLANLVFTLDIKTTDKSDSWYSHYCHGASMEIYKTVFSRGFSGLTFEDAARICYSKLNLMLIGVCNYEKGKVFVNPSMQRFLIRDSSSGLFICRQESDLQKVKEYCANCHKFVEDPKLIKKCGCGISTTSDLLPKASRIDYDAIYLQDVKSAPEFKTNQITDSDMTSTRKDHFSGHIVVCPGTSINISEMKSFIIHLKNVQNSQKHDIVSFLDENDPSASEWQTFCRQQGVFLNKGSPLVWEDLRKVDIEECKTCVILSGYNDNEETDNEAYMDSDVYSLLTTLFVRSAIKDHLSLVNEKQEIYPQAMILTEIVHDSNAIMIGLDEEEPKSLLYLSKSFASGQVFSTSVLDAFVSMIYCNPGAFNFIQALVNLDNHGCSFKNETLLLTLDDLSLQKDANLLTFEDLFLTSLSKHGIVCLGLYRYFGLYSRPSIEGDRFVITNPPKSLTVYPSDLVYCLVPSNFKKLMNFNS